MKGRYIIGLIVIILGFNFLFNLNLFRIIVAGFIIWIGWRIMSGTGGVQDFGEQSESDEDKIDRVLVFSGINKKYTANNFVGGEITSIFGGGEVDLTEVKTKDKTLNLEFTCIFGGLKVIVPQSWKVSSEGVGIIGGFENKTNTSAKKTVDVRVKGTAIFGGVELVN